VPTLIRLADAPAPPPAATASYPQIRTSSRESDDDYHQPVAAGSAAAAGLMLLIVGLALAISNREALDDERTYAAVGATPHLLSLRRAIKALTLSELGFLLGGAAAVAGLQALYRPLPPDRALAVPWVPLLALGIVTPALLAAGSYALARSRARHTWHHRDAE
jgi:uncharacterized membrane protein